MRLLKSLKKFLKFDYICYFLCFLGCIARFICVTASYEYDEIFTAITADPSLPLSWIWHTWLMPDVHPPLHNILLWVYNHFVPYTSSEIWLRAPSLLCGFVSLFIAWKWFPARFGKTAKLVFFTLLSCNFAVVFYSGHARAYSLMLMLAVALTFIFLNILHALERRRVVPVRLWLLWGIGSLILCWTHYFGALFFGLASLILFGQALLKKNQRLLTVVVPLLVLLAFSFWLVPNFMFNFSQERFSGNWWANATPWIYIFPQVLGTFLGTSVASIFGGIMWVLAFAILYGDYKRRGKISWQKDVTSLTILTGSLVTIVILVSLKIFLGFGRYLFEILPAFFLLEALLLTQVIQWHKIGKVLFICYISANLWVTFNNSWKIVHSNYFSARVSSQFFRDYAPDKEMFVIALEAFPPASLEPMYGFYLNKIYGKHTKVTELYHLDEKTRDEVLLGREKALIWMPNCNLVKLSRLSKEWNRGIALEGKLGTSCFLQLSEKGMQKDKTWTDVERVATPI